MIFHSYPWPQVAEQPRQPPGWWLDAWRCPAGPRAGSEKKNAAWWCHGGDVTKIYLSISIHIYPYLSISIHIYLYIQIHICIYIICMWNTVSIIHRCKDISTVLRPWSLGLPRCVVCVMAFSFNAAKGRSLPATWLGALAACNCSWAELLGEFFGDVEPEKSWINQKWIVYISLSLSLNQTWVYIVYSLSLSRNQTWVVYDPSLSLSRSRKNGESDLIACYGTLCFCSSLQRCMHGWVSLCVCVCVYLVCLFVVNISRTIHMYMYTFMYVCTYIFRSIDMFLHLIYFIYTHIYIYIYIYIYMCVCFCVCIL